jgi:hypothetical protein
MKTEGGLLDGALSGAVNTDNPSPFVENIESS